jgi:hypothetical protein
MKEHRLVGDTQAQPGADLRPRGWGDDERRQDRTHVRMLSLHCASRPVCTSTANSDTTGAVRAIEAIARGLRWRRAQAPLTVLGDPGREDLQACWELGAAMAAGLTLP